MKYKKFRIIVQLAIGAAILSWLLQLANLSKVVSLMLTANILNVILASIFFIIASTFTGLALYVPLKRLYSNISVYRIIMASFAGQLLSDVTPARSGYLLTPFILNKLSSIPVETGITGVLATGMANSFVKVLMALLALAYFLKNLSSDSIIVNALIAGILFLFGGGLFLLIIMLRGGVSILIDKLKVFPALGRVMYKIDETLSKIREEGLRIKGSLVQVSVLILLSLISNATALYYVSSSLWNGLSSLMDFVFIASLATVLMYVPITVAGLGVQEAGYVALLTLLGVSFERAVAFALMARALFTGTDIVGIIPLIKTGMKYR